MALDPVFYGYGIGLVMCGWTAGMVLSMVLSALKHGGRII